MGVRVTDKTNVCLYCSTTGVAFGPVFASSFDAEDFLDWFRNNCVPPDPRDLTPTELVAAYARWQTRQRQEDGPTDDEIYNRVGVLFLYIGIIFLAFACLAGISDFILN